MSSKLLRVPEVARMLDVTEARAYELVRQGVLPAVYLGRQVRVDEEKLRQWIQDGGQPLAGWHQVPVDSRELVGTET